MHHFGYLRFLNSLINFFGKVLQIIETCLSIKSKLSKILVSLVSIILDDNLKVRSVAFFGLEFQFIKLPIASRQHCEIKSFCIIIK